MTARRERGAEAEARIPAATLEWLLGEDDPAVAVLTRRTLLGEPDAPETDALWARRNEYEPVRTILDAMREDGSWLPPERDYKKYEGSLWQIVLLGELWADPADERVGRASAYAFSRQLPGGAWSANGKPAGAAPCLTANVGRGLARMGFERDERVAAALGWCANLYREQGHLGCRDMHEFALNGYCHMLAPKLLLFLAEIPPEARPDGTGELAEECVRVLRDKEVFRSLPAEFKEFQAEVWTRPRGQMAEARERFIAEHAPLHYGDKPGWLRFGFPLSYNSDALEALLALAAVGEVLRPEYEPALEAVENAADASMRWTLRNTFNGKMLADVEKKGEPSKWLTLRALQVLARFRQWPHPAPGA